MAKYYKFRLSWQVLLADYCTPKRSIYDGNSSACNQLLGIDKRVLLWDIAEAAPLADLTGHTSTVNSLSFSREGHVLASGKFREQLFLELVDNSIAIPKGIVWSLNYFLQFHLKDQEMK